jgi:hypothetical protein
MPAGSTYTPIATTTLGSAQNTITFSSIAGTYTDLVVIYSGSSTVSDFFSIRFNGDTGSNYSLTDLYGTGSSANSARFSNQTKISRNEAVGQSNAIINIMNYSNTTTYKTVLTRSNSAADAAFAVVGLWRNTAAITSVSLIHDGANFATGSMFTLYGIASA